MKNGATIMPCKECSILHDSSVLVKGVCKDCRKVKKK